MKGLMPFKNSYIFITLLFKWIFHAGVTLRLILPELRREHMKGPTLRTSGEIMMCASLIWRIKNSLSLFMSQKRDRCVQNLPFLIVRLEVSPPPQLATKHTYAVGCLDGGSRTIQEQFVQISFYRKMSFLARSARATKGCWIMPISICLVDPPLQISPSPTQKEKNSLLRSTASVLF